jgi:hypothetical protein
MVPTVVGMVLDEDTDWEVVELVTESFQESEARRSMRPRGPYGLHTATCGVGNIMCG